MNRLQQGDLSVSVGPKQIRSGTAKVKTDLKSRHRFFIPLHYEKNYAYPLFVWLHGPGGTEAEINHVMPHVSLRNYVGVATRGVVRSSTSRLGQSAFTWNQSISSVQRALEQVLDCIDEAKNRFHVAHDRIFLVGNDVGGTMALRLGLMAPQRFGGVISLGAGLPTNHQPLSGIEQARSLPIMLAHCRDSNTFDTESVCSNLRLMHTAGMKVWLRQYPCQQEVTTNMLSDVNKWIMERVLGTTAAEPMDDPTHARLEDLN